MPNARYTALLVLQHFPVLLRYVSYQANAKSNQKRRILEFYRWFDGGTCCCLAPWRHLLSYFKSHHWTFETCIHICLATHTTEQHLQQQQLQAQQQKLLQQEQQLHLEGAITTQSICNSNQNNNNQNKNNSLNSSLLKMARPKCEQVYAISQCLFIPFHILSTVQFV